jgi:hypothetical protein
MQATKNRVSVVVYAALAALVALALIAGFANTAGVQARSESGAVTTSLNGDNADLASVSAIELASNSKPMRAGWKADTAKFAGCLGGFGIAAAPVVAGFMFGGGPAGAIKAAKAWLPRLGPVGSTTLKWCMASVLGVRM